MIKKAEVTLILVAAVCIGYSSFIHFSFADAKVEFAKLKEAIETLEAKDEYSSLKVNSLVCQNIKVIDDSGSAVVKIGNEDNETFIKVLDKNKNPSIELVDNHSANFMNLRDLDKSESHITIGDTNSDFFPTLTLGKLSTGRNWVSQKFLDDINGPVFFLSDKLNHLVLQSYIGGTDQATYFQLGNNKQSPYMRSNRQGGSSIGIGTTKDNSDIIGMRVEVNDDNIYHFTNQPGTNFTVKQGVWSDLVGTYISNNDSEKKDSLFIGYSDTDYSEPPSINAFLDGELTYSFTIKNSDK